MQLKQAQVKDECDSVFFDHGEPPFVLTHFIAEYDVSPDYELDAGGLFLTENNKFVGVVVSGCS